MFQVLLIIHLLIVLALIGVVLMQRSEGGGLGIGGGGGGGGMGGFMSGRGTANLLTRTTAILAAAFMATSLVLAILAGGGRQGPASILDGPVLPNPSAPASGQGGAELPATGGGAAGPVTPSPSVPSVPVQ